MWKRGKSKITIAIFTAFQFSFTKYYNVSFLTGCRKIKGDGKFRVGSIWDECRQLQSCERSQHRFILHLFSAVVIFKSSKKQNKYYVLKWCMLGKLYNVWLISYFLSQQTLSAIYMYHTKLGFGLKLLGWWPGSKYSMVFRMLIHIAQMIRGILFLCLFFVFCFNIIQLCWLMFDLLYSQVISRSHVLS